MEKISLKMKADNPSALSAEMPEKTVSDDVTKKSMNGSESFQNIYEVIDVQKENAGT
jgi:hypothetical protein